MKLARKLLLILTLGSLFAGVGILISSIFGNNIFTGTWLKVLLSLATIVVAGAFTFNALNFMRKNKIIAYITICLISVLTVLAFIIYWATFELPPTFTKIVEILAMTTVFFNIIVSNYLKLGKSNIILQFVTYFLIAVIDVILILEILSINVLVYIPKTFVIACLVVFALLITLMVLGKKVPEETKVNNKEVLKDNDENFVKIKKVEYEALLKKIGALEAEIETLKAEKNSVDK